MKQILGSISLQPQIFQMLTFLGYSLGFDEALASVHLPVNLLNCWPLCANLFFQCHYLQLASMYIFYSPLTEKGTSVIWSAVFFLTEQFTLEIVPYRYR